MSSSSVQAVHDDGLRQEQRRQRRDDEVPGREFADVRSQCRRHHASRWSLRARPHPAATKSSCLVYVRFCGCEFQPHPHTVWGLLIRHDPLWRSILLLLWSCVQLLLWCCLKWVVYYSVKWFFNPLCFSVNMDTIEILFLLAFSKDSLKSSR